MNDENLKKGEATLFRSGEEAASAGRKGGIKSGVARRKKFASQKFLKQVLAWNGEPTPDIKKALKRMGGAEELQLTNEDIGMLALAKKFRSGDLKAIAMVLEMFGEDAYSQREEKRLKLEQRAVEHMQKSDGFIEALLGRTEEVFDDGADTPESLDEDSE